MADRFPLILNTSANQIQEIASGDQLDLSGNNIANAGVITATSFVGSGAALTGIDATAIKDSGGNVKVQAQASGAVYTGIHTFNSDLDVDGHTNLDNVSVAGVVTATTFSGSGASLTGIVNGNISASAAIAGTKISPNFGSQNIVTTGTLGSDDITITGTKPKLVLNDSNNENDFHIQNDDGTFAIKDIDSNTGRLVIASNGQTTISGNCDFGAGIDVTGNVIASGNVTAVDGTFTGDVSIGGTLTYEDVTNIDSIGIITARSDIKVGTAVTITSAGAGFFAGIVTASSFVKRDGSAVGGVTSDATYNTIGGTGAGNALTSNARDNTFFGHEAGNDVTSGDYNSIFGAGAGELISTGGHNTLLGADAGRRMISASDNVCVGKAAGEKLGSSGSGLVSGSVIIGKEAASQLTTGSYNVMVGYQAGQHVQSGRSNICMGYLAGQGAYNNSTGQYNIAIGEISLYTVQNGSFNHVMGRYAGHSITTGSYNICIGDKAGAVNTYAGNSGDLTTGSNNIIIGKEAQASSATVSNEITFGNASVTRFRIPGIGVDLTGPIGITTEALVKTNGQTASLDLSKDDHKVTATGTVTIDVTGGTEAGSHTLRIVNSGITTVGFSTYFLFPSGGAPNIPIASGTISLISFTVHRAGAVGVSTQLLSGASVSFA